PSRSRVTRKHFRFPTPRNWTRELPPIQFKYSRTPLVGCGRPPPRRTTTSGAYRKPDLAGGIGRDRRATRLEAGRVGAGTGLGTGNGDATICWIHGRGTGNGDATICWIHGRGTGTCGAELRALRSD